MCVANTETKKSGQEPVRAQKRVANIVRRHRQQLRARVETGILLHIFEGKMSEKSVAWSLYCMLQPYKISVGFSLSCRVLGSL